MTRLLHKAVLCIAGGLLIASAAMAGVPSATNSTIPPSFAMVGSLAGTPDPFGVFTVTVRDQYQNLVKTELTLRTPAINPEVNLISKRESQAPAKRHAYSFLTVLASLFLSLTVAELTLRIWGWPAPGYDGCRAPSRL